MPGRPYDELAKKRALKAYEEHGPREASRMTGVGITTLHRWARKAGVATRVIGKNKAAAEATKAKAAKLREELRALLIEKSVALVQAVAGEKVTAKDSQHLATAAAILIDKYRLEAGEVTDRQERVYEPREALARAISRIASRS